MSRTGHHNSGCPNGRDCGVCGDAGAARRARESDAFEHGDAVDLVDPLAELRMRGAEERLDEYEFREHRGLCPTCRLRPSLLPGARTRCYECVTAADRRTKLFNER